jgi:hypothetical protein
VLKRVHPFHDRLDAAVFDAGHFCMQVRRSGYVLGCCHELIVHHFGVNLLTR